MRGIRKTTELNVVNLKLSGYCLYHRWLSLVSSLCIEIFKTSDRFRKFRFQLRFQAFPFSEPFSINRYVCGDNCFRFPTSWYGRKVKMQQFWSIYYRKCISVDRAYTKDIFGEHIPHIHCTSSSLMPYACLVTSRTLNSHSWLKSMHGIM